VLGYRPWGIAIQEQVMGTIVVGLDGSHGSRAALEWALAEARLRSATVRAVHAWQLPAVGTAEAPWALLGSADYLELDPADLRKAAGDALEQELAAANPAGVTVERELVDAAPADALVDASKDAELVVVGTRGHGAIASLVLGSVSHAVTQRAACPVVVVRPPDEPDKK
jgi:nucleotide-binding universal stress UspA family protein